MLECYIRALIQRGVDAEIEKYDGHKHIDLAVVKAKLNVEIDEDRHYINSAQLLLTLHETTTLLRRVTTLFVCQAEF
ncbi:MAG: hypothetical protein ACI956_001888 [Nonlabens sp.]|jgi:hypothetical protein